MTNNQILTSDYRKKKTLNDNSSAKEATEPYLVYLRFTQIDYTLKNDNNNKEMHHRKYVRRLGP